MSQISLKFSYGWQVLDILYATEDGFAVPEEDDVPPPPEEEY
jgi:hypothetical protein